MARGVKKVGQHWLRVLAYEYRRYTGHNNYGLLVGLIRPIILE